MLPTHVVVQKLLIGDVLCVYQCCLLLLLVLLPGFFAVGDFGRDWGGNNHRRSTGQVVAGETITVNGVEVLGAQQVVSGVVWRAVLCTFAVCNLHRCL